MIPIWAVIVGAALALIAWGLFLREDRSSDYAPDLGGLLWALVGVLALLGLGLFYLGRWVA